MIHHIHRATRHLVFWSLLGTAIALTCLRLMLSGIESYKADLADNISGILGAPVIIGRIGAKMRGFSPELILKNIEVGPAPAKTPPAIRFAEIRLSANLFEIAKTRDLWSSARVTVIGAKLSVVRKADGSIAIDGISASEGSPQWLLQGDKFALLNSEITWLDQKTKAKPLLFNTVDLVLKNVGQEHVLNLLASLPKAYGESLRLSMKLTGQSLDPAALQGQIYVEGKKLRLAELLTTELPGGIQVNSGSGDMQVWVDWQQARANTVTVLADVQQAKFTQRNQGSYFIKGLQTQCHWQQSGQRWRLDVGHFALTDATKKWPDAQFNLAGSFGTEQDIDQLGLSIGHLDIQEVSELARFFLPLSQQQLTLLTAMQARGSLQNMAVFIDMAKQTGAINGRFSNLTVAAQAGMPGINKLSGAIKGTEHQGMVSVQAEHAQLVAPELFRKALEINRLQGALTWQQTPVAWLLAGQRIIADVPGLTTETQLKLEIPKAKASPVLNLESSFSSDDMAKAPLYLPVGIMGKSLVEWLDHAFISGRIPQGKLLINGSLGKFPFQDNSGVFKVSFAAEQLELAYHPDWPHLTGLSGQVEFLKNSILIKLDQGQAGEVKINQAEIRIPDMGDKALLTVNGEAHSDLKQGLAFLQDTPLKANVEPLLAALSIQGHSKLAVNLAIPLVENKPGKTEVTVELNQAKLNVKALNLWVTKLNGPLKFTGEGIYADALNAQALGQAIKIAIAREQIHTIVNVAGSAGVAELQQQFKLPWWPVAKGQADYHLKLTLPDRAEDPMQLLVKSDLEGVSLDLPGDLAKNDLQKKPLELSFDLSQKIVLPISLTYGNQLKAALKFNVPRQQVSSGHVLVGDGQALFLDEKGFALEINRDKLDIQDWLSLAMAQNKAGMGDSDIRKITIHSDHALWKSTDIGRFDLLLKPDQGYWQGDLHSKFAVGKIRLPILTSGAEKIVFTMQHLDLSALAQLKSQKNVGAAAINPDTMPLFSLNSARTFWHDHDLGMLDIEVERIPGGMVFKHIDLFGTDQKLSATGEWRVTAHGSETHVQGRLDMPQAGNMLSHLGVTKDISEASGVGDFLFHWQAAPYQFSLANLKGQFTLNLNRGRILSIEPGFGRVLGVLALAQWINRLQLDFSDIYQEGLTFNTIKGHFDLINGVAVTRNLIVDAVPAKITLTGDTDLVNQTLDQIVNVTPKSADAVPIAGTIMGKITNLVAKSLTGKEQEGFFFGSQYLVKGKWGNVQIVPLHENDGLVQKFLDGIGQFPWIPKQTTK